MSGDQIATLKRRAYKDQVFCWIESGETEKVIKFIDTYEHHAKSFVTMNSWSLPMFACRYGNLELLKYLHSKKFTQDGTYQYTLVHAACFGNEIEVLKYLIDTLKKDPVPINEQQPPLKICFRAENQTLAEFLISRGAYYQYGNFCHNVKVETIMPTAPNAQPILKYKTIQRDSKNEIIETEIPASLVFLHTNISKDSNMLSFLRFNRIRNFFYTKRVLEHPNILIIDEKKKENLQYLGKIAFENQYRTDSILEYLVGKKDVSRDPNHSSNNLQNSSNNNLNSVPQQQGHPHQGQTPHPPQNNIPYNPQQQQQPQSQQPLYSSAGSNQLSQSQQSQSQQQQLQGQQHPQQPINNSAPPNYNGNNPTPQNY